MGSGLDFYRDAIEIIRTIVIELNGGVITWALASALGLVNQAPMKKHILYHLVIPP